jgi:hypothetical protein
MLSHGNRDCQRGNRCPSVRTRRASPGFVRSVPNERAIAPIKGQEIGGPIQEGSWLAHGASSLFSNDEAVCCDPRGAFQTTTSCRGVQAAKKRSAAVAAALPILTKLIRSASVARLTSDRSSLESTLPRGVRKKYLSARQPPGCPWERMSRFHFSIKMLIEISARNSARTCATEKDEKGPGSVSGLAPSAYRLEPRAFPPFFDN